MKVNFNGNEETSLETSISRGNFENMLKERAKMLPKVEKTIQKLLTDYEGQTICIIVMKEDENGIPTGHSIMMGGVGRAETTIAMGKALRDASDNTLNLLMESVKGDPKAMVALAKIMFEAAQSNNEED